jgi:hypothetical protein
MKAVGDFFRGIGEVLGETLVEILLYAGAFAILIGLAFAAWWGWKHHPVWTVVLAVGLVGFLVFGIRESRRKDGRRKGFLVKLATGFVAFVASWLLVVAAGFSMFF